MRTWTGWHRFVTLAMLALAFLPIAPPRQRRRRLPIPGTTPATAGPIAMTAAEIRRLFGGLSLLRPKPG